ncbi:ribosome biogenesis GTPase [Paucidesulfovibrio gracilis DSM 16080]|uniref:Small ribosomal subunit biogenesis GTPase RsgA n=1 Tax=Paucidesulfovibrio gracilis DSM 16080 TaxID=1121449 RepID=A0A1T4X6W7_9BACT|nr:ribosome small subunit-dependent GTPase A [Paucidesulfovibrio gracilis]SKA85296.1 ribosome biogenesis GTPase [Paucidesulfovibrio gracilis DSM 16080]
MHDDNAYPLIDTSLREDLVRLGWCGHFDRELATMEEHLPRNEPWRMARVVSVGQDIFLVANGREEWFCTPAGRLRSRRTRDYPVTGDWVVTCENTVRAVVPRRNMLARGEAGFRGAETRSAVREQPIAANLDMVCIVCGLDRDFNPRRLERYLTLVYNCGLTPMVALTKADLHEDLESFRWDAQLVVPGVPVLLCSVPQGRGLDELAALLEPGRTAALVGSSGAGKSTLVNALYGSDVQATRDVSRSVGKGRHTTTSRELIRLPGGGLLVDNPGIREIALNREGEGAVGAFPDIDALAAQCRFADCSHTAEPGCAVLDAVAAKELSAQRLESYHKLQREMQHAEARIQRGSDRVEKERWREVSRLQRRMKKQGKRK